MANIEEAARRARARLGHFDRRGRELATSIADWGAENPVRLRIDIAADRMSWEAHWDMSEPPVEAWAMILSDAIHQLRATLDNTLHFIAEQEGASAKQLKKVQFPIVLAKEGWSDAAGRIAMLPERVASVIEQMQPFQRSEPERPSDPLWLLSELNNADKHRVILASTLDSRLVEHRFKVEFEDEPSGQEPRTAVSGKVAHDELALRQDTHPDRIKRVQGEFEYGLQVVVLDDSGVQRGITSCLAIMGSHARGVLDRVIAAWARPMAGPSSSSAL